MSSSCALVPLLSQQRHRPDGFLASGGAVRAMAYCAALLLIVAGAFMDHLLPHKCWPHVIFLCSGPSSLAATASSRWLSGKWRSSAGDGILRSTAADSDGRVG